MCIKRDNVILAVEVPTEEVFAPLGEIRQNIIIGFLFAIILTILSSILLSRKILDPLHGIVDAAKDVSLGKFITRAKVKSKDEIGYLAGIFNKMLDRIEVFQIEAETKKKSSSDKPPQLKSRTNRWKTARKRC